MDTYDPVTEIERVEDNEQVADEPDFSEAPEVVDYDPAKNLEDLDSDRTARDYIDYGIGI